ncbi:hypothetical protein KEM55_006617, partial [Ascosphaera atra]
MASPPQPDQTNSSSPPNTSSNINPPEPSHSNSSTAHSTPLGSPSASPYVLSPRSSFIGSRHRRTASGESRPRSMNHVKFNVAEAAGIPAPAPAPGPSSRDYGFPS